MAKYGKVDLELFDKNIAEKLTRTQKELEYLKSNQKSSEAQSENASNGMGDLSKLNQQMEITQSLLEKCERKVKELLAAQHRVANGTYGICEESQFADKIGKEVPGVLPSELEYLEKYPFPGNIRELENIIERAVIISVNNRLNFRNVLPESNLNAIQIPGEDIFPSLEESQKLHIIKALKKSNWKISGANSAAEILKINGKTLASRMKKLGIRKI